MKDSLANRRKMHLATQAVLTEHRSAWEATSPFLNNYNILNQLLSEFEEHRMKQEASYKGITLDKLKAKTNLVDEMLLAIGAVKSYAADTGDNTLYETVNYTHSDLLRSRSNILIDRAKLVLKALGGERENEQAMVADPFAAYGYNVDMRARFAESIAAFEKLQIRPLGARSTRKGATAALDALSDRISEHLKRKLDNNMEAFRQRLPKFYSAYKDARIIMDSGSTGTGLKGTVKDADTEMVLDNVLFELPERGATAKSNERGHYSFKRLKPGKFSLVISAEGYEEKEIKVEITEGKVSDADLSLKRVE